MAALPSAVAGFTVIPTAYKSSTHYLYAHRHAGSKKPKTGALPTDRTLFLVNIPPYSTEREFALFFKHCGPLEKVIFDQDARQEAEDVESESDEDMESAEEEDAEDASEEHPRKKRKVGKGEARPPKVIPLPSRPLRRIRRTGRSAHIVFLDSSSLDKALQPAKKIRPWPVSAEEPIGLDHYAALHDSLRPPLDIVRAHADSYMELFEYEQAQKRQNAPYRKGEAIVDEDGFTLVTRGGMYGQTLGGGVGVASKKFQESGGKRNRKKKDGADKEGFYSFQRAEKQRKNLMELQKNWEEDKAKVEKLKESRRFKPY
ncbi:hypothetical protein PLICRDRAFT_25408 [Plicaturopsis crispa FD-325 SS-3]|nr:hypothetical protein PLICRDRAFT_25408 [Plicaturopsis crispa FD-325 SS-3]